MTSPTPVIKEDPLRMLLLTTTRPISAVLNPSSYTILIQHSVCLSERLTAAAPTLSASSHSKRSSRGGRGKWREHDVDESHVFRLAGLRTPSETAERDGSGGWLVQSVFMELCERTRGKMVYVKTLDNITLSKASESDHSILRNGFVVDLSDPCGWDGNDETSDRPPDVDAGHLSLPLTNLEEVAGAIERASGTVARGTGVSTAKERTVQPIPIIFDSLGPLFAMHGVDRTIMLLQRLGRKQQKGPEDGACFIRAPIIIPVLDEVLSPSDHRRLEDCCDASVTLDRGNISIARSSSRAGSSGGKLMREMQPFQIYGGDSRGSLGGSNAVFVLGKGRHENDEETSASTEVSSDNRNNKSLQAMPTYEKPVPTEVSKANKGKVMLKHEEENYSNNPTSPRVSTDHRQEGQNRKEKPRIFVEDDDPEFDDLDEDDPDDDDLDL